jgi:hypothetical protein
MEETTREPESGKRERDERAERQRDREGELERESERLCFAECNAPSRTRNPLRHDDGGRPGVAIHGDVGLGPLTREHTGVCRWEQEGGEGDTMVDGKA